MRKISFDELHELGVAASGGIDKIYLHWSAGTYDNPSKDYHINITGAGDMLASTGNLCEKKSHTWNRNSRAVGVSMLCCADANCTLDGSVDFGSYPPTAAQIETMSKAVAVLCESLGLDISYECVKTHYEIACVDDYGPGSGDPQTKWDLWFLPDYDGAMRPGGDVIRGKAIWYRDKGGI